MIGFSTWRCLAISALLTLSCNPAQAAHPFRGSAKWSVILCTFSDSPAPTRTPDFFRNMFLNPGTGGMADYWAQVSNGGVNMAGSVVVGWYREGFTLAQENARNRGQRYQDCIDAAHNASSGAYTVPAGNFVAVVTSPGIDLFGMVGVGSFLPVDVDLGGMAHEVGHGLGFNHSFSDDPTYRNASWSQIGEYDDPWDVMSWANAFGRATTQFGFGPPASNGFHSDRMGWLSMDQVATFGADGATSRSITLKSLHDTGAGTKLIRVPFDAGDLFHYYTIELRTRTGSDTGIPTDTVLIHEVKKGASDPRGEMIGYLLRDRTTRNPVQTLNANGVTIRVDNINSAAGQANVTVTGDIAGRCLQGFVWREANASDRVCVTPQVRDLTRQDNAQAAARRNPGGGPSGPDTCRQGFVWREAFANDHVCVTPDVRTRTSQENGQAAARRNPARLAFGPNACRSGFVWREADRMDYVCVAGGIRDQARQDNAQAAARRNPGGGASGPDTCRPGFVWREAFPNDHVCVTAATRTGAANDNGQAQSRVQQP